MSDNAPRLGASLAYYTVFSISPLMVIVMAIAGFCFGQEAARKQIFDQLSGLIGVPEAQAIERLLQHAHQPQTGTFATIVAVITLLIGSTGVFVELQDALNLVWGVKPKASTSWWSFVWNRVLSFAMVLAIGFLLLVSLLLSAGLAALGQFLGGFTADMEIVSQGINFLVSFGVITLLFALIFKVLPDVKVAWRDVWVGAVITALLFALGKLLLGLYIGKTGVVSAYGAAGSVVLVLVWVYYSAQILFFGAEFTQVWANACGKELAPAPYAEPIKVQDQIPAALKRRDLVPEIIERDPVGTKRRWRRRRGKHSEHGEWKIAIPLAAVLAWFWFKERKRGTEKSA
jgi:membrane protein